MKEKKLVLLLKKQVSFIFFFEWLVVLFVSIYCLIIFFNYHSLSLETIILWGLLVLFSILNTIYKNNYYKYFQEVKSYEQRDKDNAKILNDFREAFEKMANFINSKSDFWQCLITNEAFFKNENMRKLKIILEKKIDTKILVENINYFIELLIAFYNYYQSCKELAKVDSIRFIKKNICPLCIINEVIQKFATYSKDFVHNSINSVLNDFNALKSNFESTNLFLLQNIKDFTEGEKLAEESYLQNMDVTNIFYKRINRIKEDFMESLKYYFDEFDEIFKLISSIKEIFENVKILALNLNIEASKTQNKVFMVISKEFQKLVLKIEEFNNQILNKAETSLKQIESEKMNKQKDLTSFAEFIEYAFEVQRKYDENNKKRKEVFERIINYILQVQDKNKINIFSLFKNMQELNIEFEVIVHLFEVLNSIFVIKIDNLHNENGGKIGLCFTPQEKVETYRKILEKIKTITTTKLEKDILKELNKKYLNEEIYNKEEKTEDVIIF